MFSYCLGTVLFLNGAWHLFLNFLKQFIKCLKSHGMFYASGMQAGYHRLKSSRSVYVSSRLLSTLTPFKLHLLLRLQALPCECLKRDHCSSDLFARDTKIPYRSTCCYCWDNCWHGNRHPLMLLSEGRVSFQMSEELMSQWDSLHLSAKMWADILLSGSVCCSVPVSYPGTYFLFQTVVEICRFFFFPKWTSVIVNIS